MATNFGEIQEFLRRENLDGWLMADFHGRNTIMTDFLGLRGHLTRRSFFYIPAQGEPTALIHNVERDRFTHIPGLKIPFTAYTVLEETLAAVLSGAKKIAMEYSADNRLPYIGLVDAGTIELVRSLGIEVISSADLVANFKARLTEAQIVAHRKAAAAVIKIKDEAFHFIAESLRQDKKITEWMVVEFIRSLYVREGMIYDFGPSVAVEKNISNPHYDPTETESAVIEKDRLILMDIWARHSHPDGVYGDITWVGYTGKNIPQTLRDEFALVVRARDAAVAFLKEHLPRRVVYGFEVDKACREVIEKGGMGKYFFHRTGHSIAGEVHGAGPNIDSLETNDTRKLMPGHLFSIEPGIYLGERGYRTEIDVLVTPSGPEVTTVPLQTEIIPLLG